MLQHSPYPNILYGAGHLGECYLRELKQANVHVDNIVVDDKYWSEGMKLDNIPVQKFNIINNIDHCNVLIAFGLDNKRRSELMDKNRNYKDHATFYYLDIYCFKLGNILDDYNLTYKYVVDNLTDFEKVYRMLEDDLSRDMLVNFINTKLTGDISGLTVSADDEYFPDGIIKLNDSEIFVDCGAYDGDSVLSFVSHVFGKYNKIYAFEPDMNNYRKLVENTTELSNIVLNCCGVWERKTSLSFSDKDDECSHITSKHPSNSTETIISVVSLDEVINPGDKITYLKMDIEGAELCALKGVKNTIMACNPKLAICIYHKKEDLYTIPLFLKELNPNYRIYFRQHAYYSAQLVCYAV